MQNRRQVVLFLKATGHEEDGLITYKPEYADNRITEIECLEIINGQPCEQFHAFVNTESWKVREEAQRKLGVKKLEKIEKADFFADIAADLMEFIDPQHKGEDNDTDVIVHNASYVQRLFDYAMHEVDSDWTTLCAHCNLVDVTALARKMHSVPPNQSSLNALCQRYGVDTSNRDCYSAKKDGELLMRLYLAVDAAQKAPKVKQTLFGGKANVVADKVEEAQALRHSH